MNEWFTLRKLWLPEWNTYHSIANWTVVNYTLRQTGQDTVEELRSRDFRKDLEERERQAARERVKEKGSRSATEQPKRPRLDQPPPSNLDADDPVDDDDDDDSDERYICLLLLVDNVYIVLGRNHPEIQICYGSKLDWTFWIGSITEFEGYMYAYHI